MKTNNPQVFEIALYTLHRQFRGRNFLRGKSCNSASLNHIYLFILLNHV